MSFISPRFLQAGDTVAITCPAKKLPAPITPAVQLLESWGLNVLLGESVNSSYNQFAGSDDVRARDLQKFLDDESVRTIFAARGGYGTIRIIDRLDFSRFEEDPKWLVGFSDITLLLSHISRLGIQSIHGQMPISVPDSSSLALQSLRDALFGGEIKYAYKSSVPGRNGQATGLVTGGNLTLLVMSLGSFSEPEFEGKILFLEDVGEYLYSVDRMILTLKRAGKLRSLAGLVIGGFTDLKDNEIPFGQSVAEMIMEHTKEYNYPLCFDFPGGHIPDNRSLIFGRRAQLTVDGVSVSLSYP